MFCKHCGNQLADDAKFCVKCGNSVEVVVGNAQVEVAPIVPLAGTGSIIANAWTNYQSKFLRLIGLQLLGLLPLGALGLIGFGLYKLFFESSPNPVVIVLMVLVMIVAVIAVIFWAIWVQAASIKLLLGETNQSIKESLHAAKSRLSNYFWSSVISSVIIMAGFILLVIPGIIFLVWYGFATIIAVAENTGAVDSVRISKAYVQGQWWKVFGRLVVLFLVFIAIHIPIMVLSAIVAAVVNEAAGEAIWNVVGIVTGPFMLAVGVSLYQSVKASNGVIELPVTGRTKYIVFAVLGLMTVPLMLFASVVLLSLNSARGVARDAQRVAYVQQLTGVIDLYYNDKGAFPPTLNSLLPDYMATILDAPTPPDGECTAEQNQISYKLISEQEYSISFCLGSETQGLPAGVNVISSNDIYEQVDAEVVSQAR